MARGKLPGCKEGKLPKYNWETTLVIEGIYFANNQGINIADYS